MEKIIQKKTYNTLTASLLAHACVGAFGDPAGYEESLYRTKKGSYFFHGIGGEASPYPQEDIRAATEAEALAFLDEHAL